MTECNVAVLGEGVLALTTALELQSELRNATVTILAENFNSGATDSVASTLFRPSASFTGPNEIVTKKWIRDSYNYWDRIMLNPEAAFAGVVELSGYMFSNEPSFAVGHPHLQGLLPLYRAATDDELKICPGGWNRGFFFTSILVDGDVYAPWATEKFISGKGKIVATKVNSFSELSDKYSVIVNCSGVEGQHLVDDPKLLPIREQILKVNAPWCKTFFFADYDTYVMPRFNGVTLGGCSNFASYNLKISEDDRCAIKKRCEALVPSLKSSQILEERVGLRPFRDEVRIEKQLVVTANGKVNVVHNYGHGENVVIMAPGTAKHAVELVKEMLKGNYNTN